MEHLGLDKSTTSTQWCLSNLRIDPWKRNISFQTIIFRFKLLIFRGVSFASFGKKTRALNSLLYTLRVPFLKQQDPNVTDPFRFPRSWIVCRTSSNFAGVESWKQPNRTRHRLQHVSNGNNKTLTWHVPYYGVVHVGILTLACCISPQTAGYYFIHIHPLYTANK